ncbi:DUF6597 domain-containing transcriptional factor [Microlunatus sp. Gsoil 973]|uniref:DUF6597 domain-containing transcriptional factor n=1 Tax=Microlunatus sp. Gsoil 973 TaxID=2672569 RepID=UPI0018A8216C|nr:DUF6597 domain-containing transcriptional factor [Microlunatus sp. Gsoil 973]
MTVGNTSHRGILALPGRLPYRLDRLLPPEQLGWCVDRFWMTEWDIPQGRAVTARILPHPTVNLTLEGDGLVITGVASGVFARTLTGHGQVFGIKLRPGAARLLTDVPIRSLSGTGQPAEGLLAAGANWPQPCGSRPRTPAAPPRSPITSPVSDWRPMRT